MSSIRFGREREYRFYRREELRTRWDLGAATAFMNGFRGDAVAMAQFRRHATSAGAVGTQGNLTDEQVIQFTARQLVSGALVVTMPQRSLPLADMREAAEVPQPAAPREARVAEKPEDEPTFERGHDGAAQAAVLIAAAKAAYPFCEECQKHMVEEMQAAGR